jgi:hypothetical protein
MPPNDMPAPPSAEQIARHYAAMLDSVSLINALVPTQDDKALESVARNVLHLEQMLTNNWWAGYDLAPINAAITAGKQ